MIGQGSGVIHGQGSVFSSSVGEVSQKLVAAEEGHCEHGYRTWGGYGYYRQELAWATLITFFIIVPFVFLEITKLLWRRVRHEL